VLLNPSIGDEDGHVRPTLDAMVRWSRRWAIDGREVGGLVICNLFARRGRYPRDVKRELHAGLDVVGNPHTTR
jgi:hypothetical protein